MNYYVCEGTPQGEYNASTKAREDVEYILDKLDFKKFYIPTKYGVQQKKIMKFKQFIDYRKNNKIWEKTIENLNKEDMLVIQYPLINSMLGFEKIMDKLQKLEIKTVLLIHDLDSLRMGQMPRVVKEDREVLKRATYIIAHNNRMKNKIVEICNVETSKIFELKIFDYILENPKNLKPRTKDLPVVIAGNLSKEKAEYLKHLKDVKNVEFNLYGAGYEKEEGETNVNYKGKFLPDKLVEEIEGSFGLVWDGETIEECTRTFWRIFKI